MLKHEYARSALKLGLRLGKELGVNPYKFGLSAGTDSHTGLATSRESVPFSLFDSQDPEDLWKHLARYEAKTGGNAIAIPHNGNLSNGLMFAEKTFSGKKLTRAYAETRIRWEPIIEVTQIKGDGERRSTRSQSWP